MDEIQASVNEQKASIENLQASFEERLDRLEDQLSSFVQSFEETDEIQSMRRDTHSVRKDLKRVTSSSSLNASLNEV